MTALPADRGGAPGAGEANVRAARALAHALEPPEGMLEVVLSPGSRNTPLTLAFDELATAGRARLHVVLDERAAAFVALGLAKRSGRAAVLCCTSGSAAGHYVPAVMEAGNSRVPLVMLTADRPPELHRCGAAQTVDQVNMFAPWARASLVAPVPDEATDPRRLAALGRQVRRIAEGSPAGPVHLDVPFRKPLWSAAAAAEPLPEPRGGSRAGRDRRVAAASVVDALAKRVATDDAASRGVLLCGPRASATIDDDELTRAVTALSDRLGWPVIADPASGLGAGVARRVAGYDAFLRHEPTARALAPSAVLQLGGAPTSKATNQWLTRFAAGKLVVVDGDGELADPNGLDAELMIADPVAACEALASRDGARAAPSWSERWREVARHTAEALDPVARLAGWQGHLARATASALPAGALLHVASSMPIREVDAFGGDLSHLEIQASRGVNGIDGTLATFLGEMLARRVDGQTAPGVALVGDLAFLHDLDGLATWAQVGRDLPATVVVVDNGGGRIFDLLPIAQQLDDDRFERLFATPQRAAFGPLCEAFGHRHHRASAEASATFLAQEIERPGLGIITVAIDPERDRRLHERAFAELRSRLDETRRGGDE